MRTKTMRITNWLMLLNQPKQGLSFSPLGAAPHLGKVGASTAGRKTSSLFTEQLIKPFWMPSWNIVTAKFNPSKTEPNSNDNGNRNLDQ